MNVGYSLIATKKHLRKRVLKQKLFKWFWEQKQLSAKEILNFFIPYPIIVHTFSDISRKFKKRNKSLPKFAKEGHLDRLFVVGSQYALVAWLEENKDFFFSKEIVKSFAYAFYDYDEYCSSEVELTRELMIRFHGWDRESVSTKEKIEEIESKLKSSYISRDVKGKGFHHFYFGELYWLSALGMYPIEIKENNFYLDVITVD